MSFWDSITSHPILKGATSSIVPNIPSGTDISNAMLGGVTSGYGLENKELSDLITGVQDLDLDFLRQVYLTNVANSYNKSAQQDYQNWLQMMSGSAYQRQAEDLKKAGYNPALVLGAGGASVPASGYSSYESHSAPATGAYKLKASNTAYKYEALKWQNMRFIIDKATKMIERIMPSSKDLLELFK